MEYVPELLQSHAYIHPNQIKKLNMMDKLMFDCWRLGYKRAKILPLAQEIESSTTDKDVSIYFGLMFRRELSDKALYLTK